MGLIKNSCRLSQTYERGCYGFAWLYLLIAAALYRGESEYIL
jgi:hypothetical protein